MIPYRHDVFACVRDKGVRPSVIVVPRGATVRHEARRAYVAG
mgnify:CR=1 FL=1